MPEPTLYQDKVEPAKQEIILNDPRDNDVNYAEINPFDDSKENYDHILGWIKWRFDQMNSARPDADWDLRYKQYLALISWNADGSANVNLPIEFATIRNKMADAMSMRPIIKFRPQEKDDIAKIEVTKVVWDFAWGEAQTDKELFDLYMGAYIFGTYPWYEYIHKEINTRYVPEIGKDGKVNHKAVTETRSWLKGRAWDIRDVWVDLTHDLETSEDCFLRERDVSWDQLNNLKNDPNYKNIDEALKAVGFDQNYQPFQTTEEMQNYNQLNRKYALYHYYNKRKGILITSVNFQIIIRVTANPFAHGELPISFLVDHKNLQQIYGRGECEILENTKYERNVNRNQFVDYVRASNTIALAIGDNAAYESSDLINGIMQVWNFSGSLGDSQVIKPPGMDSGLIALDNLLQNDATWQTGIDNNSLVGNPTKTAFEARLQEVTKLKGVGISLKQADYFYERMAKQRLANIQQFMPSTTGKKLLGDKKTRTIVVENKRAVPIKGVTPKGEVQEIGTKFEEAKGEYSFLELTPELIKSNLDIVIDTPSTSPILKEIDKSEMAEVFNNIVQIAQVKPDILQQFDAIAWLKDRIEALGYDADTYFTGAGTAKQEIDKVKSDIVDSLPMPPKARNQPSRSNADMLGALMGQGQVAPETAEVTK